MSDGPHVAPRTEPAPSPFGAPPPATSKWTFGRVAMIVIGTVIGLLALCAIAVGAYGLWLQTTQRSDGYVMTSSERFATGGYALATDTLHISSDVPSFLYGRDWLGDVRIRGANTVPDQPLFIGIARKADVDRYLAGVAHSEVVDVSGNAFNSSYKPTYRAHLGGAPALPPVGARFWVARVAGRGEQTLTWSVKSGDWSVVVMRPDGARVVTADLAAGAKLPALAWVSIVLLAAGLLVLAGAAALIVTAGRRASRGAQPPGGPLP